MIHALISFFLICRNNVEAFTEIGIAEVPFLMVKIAPSLMIAKAKVFITGHNRLQ